MFHSKRPLFVLGFALAAALCTRSARADDPKPGDPPAPAPNDETRGYVGYSAAFIETLTVQERSEKKIDHVHGLYVALVTMGTPADKAGLKVADVLISVNGQAIPDTSKVDAKDDAAREKYMKEQFGKIVFAVKPGDTVTIVVDRQGRTETIKAVAVTKDEMEKLIDAAQRESQAVQVPDWKIAGAPNASASGFEGLDESKERPDDLLVVTGFCDVIEEEGKTPVNHVLHQHTDIAGGFDMAVFTGSGKAYPDGTISVRFNPIGGEKSVSGGIAFRVQTWKNFYVAVADGVSKTVAIVLVADGKAKVVASKPIGSPKLKSWHTLEVTFVGSKMKAVYDGSTTVETDDATFSNGWAGPCVGEDADTLFDDWKAAPAAK